MDIDRFSAFIVSTHVYTLYTYFSVMGKLSGIDNLAGTTCNRVVQESMTNAHCHGQGVVELTIGVLPEEVPINCVNRVGNSDREQLGRGYGQIGMRERVQAAHGKMATSVEAGRHSLSAVIPIGSRTDRSRVSHLQ